MISDNINPQPQDENRSGASKLSQGGIISANPYITLNHFYPDWIKELILEGEPVITKRKGKGKPFFPSMTLIEGEPSKIKLSEQSMISILKRLNEKKSRSDIFISSSGEIPPGAVLLILKGCFEAGEFPVV